MVRRMAATILTGLVACWVTGCLTGCAGHRSPGVATAGGRGAAVVSASQPAADPEERARQFVRCLREHGAEVPDADPGGGDVVMPGGPAGKATVLDAIEKCRAYEPPGGKFNVTDPAVLERLRALARCMRAHGLPEWPDPDPATGVPAFADHAAELAAKRDPHLREATRACRDVGPTPAGDPKGGVG